MAKYSVKFAKVNEERQLDYAPLPLVINGENVWTNISEVYVEQGYYPIEFTDEPVKAGFYYSPYWVLDEENKVCRQEWEEHEIPDEPIGEVATEEDIQNAIAEGVNSIDN